MICRVPLPFTVIVISYSHNKFLKLNNFSEDNLIKSNNKNKIIKIIKNARKV